MRSFVGIDLGRDPAPDETTVCKFRHLPELNEFGAHVFAFLAEHPHQQGLRVRTGTIVDATIIAAPSSTKNKANPPDPEMRQSKERKQWHFGMKGHVGVDRKSHVIYSVVSTAAHVHDGQVLEDLLHGEIPRARQERASASRRSRVDRPVSGTKIRARTDVNHGPRRPSARLKTPPTASMTGSFQSLYRSAPSFRPSSCVRTH